MPRTKWTLTQHELIEHAARSAQLRAMGIDIEVPPPPSSVPAVDFEIGDNYDYICNFFSNMILIIGARFTAQASGVLQADQVAVSLPTQDRVWDFLDMPRGKEPLPHLALYRDQVLNDRLVSGVRLRRDESLSGVLVLVGWDAHLPAEYVHGTHLMVEIALSDLSGAELRAKSTVYVNRKFEAELGTARTQKKMAEGTGLCAGTLSLPINEEVPLFSAEDAGPPERSSEGGNGQVETKARYAARTSVAG